MLSSAVGCVQREPSVSPSGAAGGILGVSAQVWASPRADAKTRGCCNHITGVLSVTFVGVLI